MLCSANQVDAPYMKKSTMNEFFSMLRAYVHLLGVRDESAGVQTSYLSGEGQKYGSHAVISMLHRYQDDHPEVGNNSLAPAI